MQIYGWECDFFCSLRKRIIYEWLFSCRCNLQYCNNNICSYLRLNRINSFVCEMRVNPQLTPMLIDELYAMLRFAINVALKTCYSGNMHKLSFWYLRVVLLIYKHPLKIPSAIRTWPTGIRH